MDEGPRELLLPEVKSRRRVASSLRGAFESDTLSQRNRPACSTPSANRRRRPRRPGRHRSTSAWRSLADKLAYRPAGANTGEDFNWGFGDVYPSFVPANGIYTDKLPVPTGRHPPNPDVARIIEFRDRIRNGMYHLAYTKNGVWLHNDPGYQDFQITQEPAPGNPTQTLTRYRMNPHQVIRTLVDHFPTFIARVRNRSSSLQNKFESFFDDYHAA